MKLLNSLRARKLNFLFCLLLSHLFIVSAVSGNVCKNIPTKGDWGNCNEHLKPDFMPICPISLCEALIVDPSSPFHKWCMDNLYVPVQSMDCCNPEAQEWIQALPGYENISPKEILQACAQLDDPWILGVCYCCCGGLGSIQTDSTLSSESQNEL